MKRHKSRSPKKQRKTNPYIVSFFLLVALLVFALGTRAYWATLLSTQPINTIYGKALSINDNGQVLIVGAINGFEKTHPIIWKDVIETEVTEGLSDMHYIPPSPNVFNNKTEFVGSDTIDGSNQAFIWRPSVGVQNLGTTVGSVQASMTQAYAINNQSQVVGIYVTSINNDYCSHLFVWHDGVWKTLDNDNLLCSIIPTDINDNGVITGYTLGAEGSRKAFILDSNTNAFTEISSPSYKDIYPWSIGNDNKVVGQAVAVNDMLNMPKAFLWQAGTYTYLGTLGGDRSIAYSINADGYIAGESNVKSGNPEYHAFVIQRNVMVDLGVLDADIGVLTQGSDALSINTTGIIVGTNYTFNPNATPDAATGVTNFYQTPITWDYILTKIKKPKNIRNPHNTPTPTPIGR